MDPIDLSMEEAIRCLRRQELSAVELLDSYLCRIETIDGSIHAWAATDFELARSVARERDLVAIKRPDTLPKLHGIPVGVKDVFWTTSFDTEAGSPTLKGNRPREDAAVVHKLSHAGAVIIGKTVTTEFAGPDPAPTTNPWDVARTPGGSSAGSAAAVASRMCLAAVGTQSGGSTLRPAAYCGVVGLKPRHGRISTFGMVPINPIVDHVGLFARSVSGVAMLLSSLSGLDLRDPYTLQEVGPECAQRNFPGGAPRLAVMREGFCEYADIDMRNHFDGVCSALSREGADLVEVWPPPDFELCRQAMLTILDVGFAAQLGHALTNGTRFAPGLTQEIRKGLEVSGIAYAAAVEQQVRLRRKLSEQLISYDAVLTPAATGAPPLGRQSTGDPVMQFPWSLTGHASLALPTGLSGEGLPLAIQLMTVHDCEGGLLRAANWCAARVGLPSSAWEK